MNMIKTEKELLAICENVKTFCDKPLCEWEDSDFTVRKLANDTAKNFGYGDWLKAYEELKVKFTETR